MGSLGRLRHPGESSAVAEAAVEPGTDGKNSWGNEAYGGPCPPGGTHHYVFHLWALDARLGLAPGATKRELVAAMEGRVLSEATLIGTYAR